MMKLKHADKLSGLMEYGHNTKGLENKNFDSLYRKSNLKGIRQNKKSHSHASKYKRLSRRFNKKGRKRNGFSFQFIEKNTVDNKISATKIFPLGADRLHSKMPLNGKPEENKDPTGV